MQPRTSVAAQVPHPYDYCWRPGTALRPAPPRAAVDGTWWRGRLQHRAWIDVTRIPRDTPRKRMMADHMWQGDELMDNVVMAFRRTPAARGRTMLEQALDHGIESVAAPPQELVTLFADLDTPPDWFDAHQWERGRRLWINTSLSGKLSMVTQDFMGTFVGEEVSSATGGTRRFLTMPYRRTLETLTWASKASGPCGYDRWSQSFRDTTLIRYMHAQARAGLRAQWGDDHFSGHGNPISMSTTMGAAVTMGLSPLVFDHLHGRRHTIAELDAVMMYWAYIARLFGVPNELIPRTAVEGLEMVDFMLATAAGPTPYTTEMATAFTDWLLKPDGIRGGLYLAAAAPVVGMLGYLSGDERLVRALLRDTPLAGIPTQPWATLTAIAANFDVAARRIDDRLPGARGRACRRTEGDDQILQRLVGLATYAATRQGIRGTPYNHHDATGGDDIPA